MGETRYSTLELAPVLVFTLEYYADRYQELARVDGVNLIEFQQDGINEHLSFSLMDNKSPQFLSWSPVLRCQEEAEGHLALYWQETYDLLKMPN